MGTDVDMLDFPLDFFYPHLASDEGPPFGEPGIGAMEAGELLDAFAGDLLRRN